VTSKNPKWIKELSNLIETNVREKRKLDKNINKITEKSKLTKKDVDEVSHKINREVFEDIKKANLKEIFGSLKGKKIGG